MAEPADHPIDHPIAAVYNALSIARVLRELLYQAQDLAHVSPSDLAVVMDVLVEQSTAAVDRMDLMERRADR